ncbi:MAG: hypothetical protein KME57_31500 [Scytonema hyalinum WJT4-NPBG1]|nr:hypothetical protein [Scytonema hyalinum WJT4-NPBG1]
MIESQRDRPTQAGAKRHRPLGGSLQKHRPLGSEQKRDRHAGWLVEEASPCRAASRGSIAMQGGF